jgi:diamine N-acetyltransferase
MAKKTPSIRYIHGDQTNLDQIKPLWEGLNRCMGERSTYFKRHFETRTWEIRRVELLKNAASGLMRVELAVDEETAKAVGYLVSSVNSEKLGTVESIFVSEGYRGLGVGESLMKNALAWMDQNGIVEKIVEVTVGNEQVYGFYERFGFLPRQTLLKQLKK